jgi:WD40 repeat protein
MSADGRWAVSASYDHTLKFWDVERGRCLATFTCDGAALCCAIVGDRIVAGDETGRVCFLVLEQAAAQPAAARCRLAIRLT